MFPDGALYVDEFFDALRHSQGAQRCSDSRVYCGSWFKDKEHGLCSYRFSAVEGLEENCDRYEGLWKEGRMYGQGHCFFSTTGDVFEGDFEGNEMSGQRTHAIETLSCSQIFVRGMLLPLPLLMLRRQEGRQRCRE
jgi:hypothetical protein